MKIAHRLQLLIALPLLFLVAVGGYALNRLDLVGERGQYVIDNTLPSYETLYALALDARRIDALAVKRISVSKPEAAERLESALSDARKRLGQNLEHYRKDLVSDEEDRAKIAKVSESMSKFLSRTDAVLAAARAGKAEEAHAAYDAGREDAETLNKQVEADIAFNRKVGDEFTTESRRIFKISMGSLIASVVACAIAIIALGWLTLSAVMRPMQAMRDTAAVSGKLDLTLRTPVIRKDEIGVTAEAFNALLARLQDSLLGMKKNSDAVFEATTGVSTAAGQVSTSSSYQSDAAANMAASVEEMTVSISQIAQKAGETSELAAAAGRAASEGEGVIRATTNEMNGVSKAIEAASADIKNVEDKSRQIERVVTVIKEVADQTNLLALNAAIEAARAGEEGRGFAVVADEVRKLAQRVAESTEEIAHAVREMRESVNGGVASIDEVARHVESGVKLADSASAAIGRINTAVGDSVQAVAEISHTIQEQSAAMTSIAQQVEKIAQMTEENSAAAGSTATTAEQLGRITDSMNAVMGAFKVAA